MAACRRIGQRAGRDSRLSRVPAGGPLARVRDGDVIRLDSIEGSLEAQVPEDSWAGASWRSRSCRATRTAWAGSCSELFAPPPATPNPAH